MKLFIVFFVLVIPSCKGIFVQRNKETADKFTETDRIECVDEHESSKINNKNISECICKDGKTFFYYDKENCFSESEISLHESCNTGFFTVTKNSVQSIQPCFVKDISKISVWDLNGLNGHWSDSWHRQLSKLIEIKRAGKLWINNTSNNWNGLLLKIGIKCHNSPSVKKCTIVKFIGPRIYPLDENLLAFPKTETPATSAFIKTTTEETTSKIKTTPPSTSSSSTTLQSTISTEVLLGSTSSTKEDDNNSTTWIIIGAVAAVLSLVLIIIVIIFLRHRRKSTSANENHPQIVEQQNQNDQNQNIYMSAHNVGTTNSAAEPEYKELEPMYSELEPETGQTENSIYYSETYAHRHIKPEVEPPVYYSLEEENDTDKNAI